MLTCYDIPREARLERLRFIRKMLVGDGCWEWTSSCDPRGYGRFSRFGGPQYAHRVAYELFVGPIPDGMCVCHHCDNPACVRPDHLFLGTARDNALDRSAKGRSNRGHRVFSSRLSESDVRVIRERLDSGESRRSIASDYGVSKSSIGSICTGETWSWLA